MTARGVKLAAVCVSVFVASVLGVLVALYVIAGVGGPFTAALSGSEWRSWRLAAKRLVIGGNVTRGVAQVASGAAAVLVSL